MENDLAVLTLTAGTIGILHAALGPDHYLPFVMLSRSEGWSRGRTLWITLACGVGHVLSSVLLGALGIALGLGVAKLESIEKTRGEFAVWGLIAFGLVYAVWGLRRAMQNQAHAHVHAHMEGTVHLHPHVHQRDHMHVHQAPSGDPRASRRLTPWVLFTIFIFGPCEPLIPLLMYPAAQRSTAGAAVVTLVFAAATLTTMTMIVTIALTGIRRLPFGTLERYNHALAGSAILLCGIAIAVFGL